MILCLSPHLDDAALSCGAQLWQYAREGQSVHILNIFSATDQTEGSARFLGYRASALATERQREEQAAMTKLGVASESLDWLDAPFRNRRYRAYHQLFAPLSKREQPLVEALRSELETRCQALQPRLILAPLASGGHIDHQIVHQAAHRLTVNWPVAFYEDMPYSLAPWALLRRLGPQNPHPDWSRIRRESHRYYAHHPVYAALPRWQQALVWPGIRLWLWQQERQSRQLAPRTWNAQIRPCSGAALQAKVAAIAAYSSQFKRMFLSPERCAQQLSDYARGFSTSAYAERLWLPLASKSDKVLDACNSLL